ncbi:hypothetical protein ACFVYC_04640 [Pseudarthrobacter sp. NPDC058329]|uniref:hypothetical protein n=1 Tax=Pseudarthrobacter sp. NPDC058329 TaxID=3346448 RepID=UPI0036D75C1D
MTLDRSNEYLVSQMAYLLSSSGAKLISRSQYESWPETASAYEDKYSIIAIWTYESFSKISDQWIAAQDEVIKLMSSNISSSDPKAWDGYLLLVTNEGIPSGMADRLNEIRTDTRRIRKLVITGDDLPGTAGSELEITQGIRRLLAPVLNVSIERSLMQSDPLTAITDRSEFSHQMESDLMVALGAYRRGLPMVEAIHLHEGLDAKNEGDSSEA